MILSISEQTLLFLTAVLFGGFSAFIYDLIRVFRMIFKHKRIFIHMEDILYWLSCTFTLFLIMLQKNFGEIRFFTIVGTFLGMIIYFFSLSRIFMQMSEKIINTAKKIIKILIKIILTPFNILFSLLYRIFGRPILRRFKKIKIKIIEKTQPAQNINKIKKSARQKCKSIKNIQIKKKKEKLKNEKKVNF